MRYTLILVVTEQSAVISCGDGPLAERKPFNKHFERYIVPLVLTKLAPLRYH